MLTPVLKKTELDLNCCMAWQLRNFDQNYNQGLVPLIKMSDLKKNVNLQTRGLK